MKLFLAILLTCTGAVSAYATPMIEGARLQTKVSYDDGDSVEMNCDRHDGKKCQLDVFFKGRHHLITPETLGSKYYMRPSGLKIYKDIFDHSDNFIVDFDVWCPDVLESQEVQYLCRASLSVDEGRLTNLQVFRRRAPEGSSDEFDESMIENIEVAELTVSADVKN